MGKIARFFGLEKAPQGRKAGSTTVKKEALRIGRQVSMSDAEWQTIDEEAKRRGLSRSALIRLAIERLMKDSL